MTFVTANKPTEQQPVTFRLIVAIIGAVFGSVQHGYNLGVMNSPQMLIKTFIRDSLYQRRGTEMPENSLRIIWALTVSIFAIGGCCGGLLAGPLATRIGRKRGCLANISLGVLASGLIFLSRRIASIEAVVIARFLLGCHCGLYSGLVTMYLSEISTSNIRGGVGVVHQVGIVTGMLFSQVLGFPDLLGTESTWDILLGLAIFPCLLQAVILPFCPESPRYLLISKKDETGAINALTILRGQKDVELEVLEIKHEMSTCGQQVAIVGLFRDPSLRRPTLIAIALHLSLQFSGIGGIFFYSTSLFKATSNSESVASYTTSAVGGVMLLLSFLTIPLVDRLGRRICLLAGFAGIAVCGILITVALMLQNQVEWFGIASNVCLLMYVIFFTIGPGSVAWVMSAEFFSHDARPAAMSIIVLTSNLANFAVGFVFPSLQNCIEHYVFLPFAVLMIVSFVFTFVFVPETNGKTYEEISAVWRPKSAANLKDCSGDLQQKNGLPSVQEHSAEVDIYRM